MSFWKSVSDKPLFALAPMEDVTDTVFRELIAANADHRKLQLMFTEFLSVDGFLHDSGKEKVKHRLYVSQQEHVLLKSKEIKLVVQIWGSDPEKFYRAAKEITECYDFDGIDINMGCPVGKIIKKKACSALINHPELAREIIMATKEATHLPVSVKTRIGFNQVDTENWIGQLLETKPAAITIHGRTQKMRSEGLADWEEIRKATILKNLLGSETLILGNGDVMSYSQGLEKAARYNLDGIMVGRGIFKDPMFFSVTPDFSIAERIELLKYHIIRFRSEWEGIKNYAILKRFYKIYVNGFFEAGNLRALLMETRSYSEALKLIADFQKNYSIHEQESEAKTEAI